MKDMKIKTFEYPELKTQVDEIHDFLKTNKEDHELVNFYLSRKKNEKHFENYYYDPQRSLVFIVFKECRFKITIGENVERVC